MANAKSRLRGVRDTRDTRRNMSLALFSSRACTRTRKNAREDGQSTVEFAIVLPILLLVVLAIVEFGLFFNLQISLDFAAREGVRYAAVHSGDDTLVEDIEDRLVDSAVGEYTVLVSFTSPDEPKDGDVTVTVRSTYKPLTPIGMLIFGGNLKNMSSSLTLKVDN